MGIQSSINQLLGIGAGSVAAIKTTQKMQEGKQHAADEIAAKAQQRQEFAQLRASYDASITENENLKKQLEQYQAQRVMYNSRKKRGGLYGKK